MHRLDGPHGGGSGGGQPPPAAPLVAPPRENAAAWTLTALVLALALHGAAIFGLAFYIEWKKLHPDPVRENIPIEVAMVEKPPPPPPAEPPKPPPPPKPVPMKLTRAPKLKPKLLAPPPPQNVPPPPPSDLPPPPNKEAKSTTNEPVRVLSGITLESTVGNGAFAAPVGNTLYGTPSRVAPEPAQIKPYKAERYAPAAQVNELPHVLSQPDLRRFYPDEARKSEFEGDVVLRLLIDSDGSIAKIDVVSDPGKGLGRAAALAIKDFRFSPGKVNGTPVATTVPFVLKFVLN